MTQLEVWIERLEELEVMIPRCVSTLAGFHDPTCGFVSTTGDREVSIVSHGLCVEKLMAFPRDTWPRSFNEKVRRHWLTVLLESEWKTGKPESERIVYVDTFAIPALWQLKDALRWTGAENAELKKRLADSKDKLSDAVSRIPKQRPRGGKLEREPLSHAMIYFRIRRALNLLLAWWKTDEELSPAEAAPGELEKDISNLDDFLELQFTDRLSKAAAVTDNHEDALELGYLTYVLVKFGELKNDVLADFGIRLCLSVLFGERPLPRPQGIYKSSSLNISATPFEVLALLSELPQLRNKFADYAVAYDRAFEWLKETQREGWTDFKVPPTWRAEPWRGQEKAEAWLNANIVSFIVAYHRVLHEVCGAVLTVDLEASLKPAKIRWEQISELGGFKHQLRVNIIDPIKRGMSFPLRKASIILFGPPGTAKTTIAQAMADELQWPLVTVLPHHFAQEGMEGVIRRAREVFRRLMIIQRAVVFFDEVDELVRSRSNEPHNPVGRFITTCMLPWFQNLRERGRIVFIVATNFIENFDAAIKRPGRFDYVIPVAPPTAAERESILDGMLSAQGLRNADERKSVIAFLSRIIKSKKLPLGSTISPVKKGENKTKKAKTLDWMPTIGELDAIAERVASKHKEKTTSAKVRSEIEAILNIAVAKPLISAAELDQFQKDQIDYQWPREPES